MMNDFPNSRGMILVEEMIRAIQENKQYLSDIDGLIGDGDHGINMNKGFTLCQEELRKNPGDLTHVLRTLSGVLMMQIGGSMGPLYGTFFEAMADASAGVETIDSGVFGRMLEAAVGGIGEISDARVGDKTLLDTLVPAFQAFQAAAAAVPGGFPEALDALEAAAIKGRDSTKDLVAKKGRASRLGERSRGVPDAGAVSCCLILRAMAAGIRTLLR